MCNLTIKLIGQASSRISIKFSLILKVGRIRLRLILVFTSAMINLFHKLLNYIL